MIRWVYWTKIKQKRQQQQQQQQRWIISVFSLFVAHCKQKTAAEKYKEPKQNATEEKNWWQQRSPEFQRWTQFSLLEIVVQPWIKSELIRLEITQERSDKTINTNIFKCAFLRLTECANHTFYECRNSCVNPKVRYCLCICVCVCIRVCEQNKPVKETNLLIKPSN